MLLLPLGDGLQGHFHPTTRDHIIRLQRPDTDTLSVYKNTVLRVGIGNGPAAVIVPGQNAVTPGNRGKIHNNITAFASADHIFPMGDGQRRPPTSLRGRSGQKPKGLQEGWLL